MHHYAGVKCRIFLYTIILETAITLAFLAGRSLKVNIGYFCPLVKGLDRYLHCDVYGTISAGRVHSFFLVEGPHSVWL